jgi:hypothetical protein
MGGVCPPGQIESCRCRITLVNFGVEPRVTLMMVACWVIFVAGAEKKVHFIFPLFQKRVAIASGLGAGFVKWRRNRNDECTTVCVFGTAGEARVSYSFELLVRCLEHCILGLAQRRVAPGVDVEAKHLAPGTKGQRQRQTDVV